MQTSDLLRHQIIKSLMAQHTGKIADAAILLWEQMATQIISIVGEGGFCSLYARSIFLTQPAFPWLASGTSANTDNKLSSSAQTEQRFAGLRASFERQTPAQARAANSLLLLNFTDILASLIGEQLTISMLRMAWGPEALLAAAPENASDQSVVQKFLSENPKEFKQ